LGVKRPGRVAAHLHLVPRAIMRGAIPPLPQYAFMVWCSVKESIGTTLLLPPHFTHYYRTWKSSRTCNTQKLEHAMVSSFKLYETSGTPVTHIETFHDLRGNNDNLGR
jgi:hypothetical protein